MGRGTIIQCAGPAWVKPSEPVVVEEDCHRLVGTVLQYFVTQAVSALC